MTRLRIILLAALAITIAAVCIRLGFWQLERLAERRAENARVAAGLGASPIPVTAVSADSTRSRAQRVEVSGTYDFAHEVTLINRSRDGAPGVNILTPLRIAGRDSAVMVNRGWVYSPDGASIDLARWREPVEAEGTAYVSWLGTAGPDSVGARGIAADTATRRVVRLHHAAIARLVPYPVAPYQLVLIEPNTEGSDAGGYGAATPAPFGTAVIDSTRPIRIPLPALDEGPHRSYALQWFAFAAIALIGTGVVVRSEWSRMR